MDIYITFRELTLIPTSSEVIPSDLKNEVTPQSSSASAAIDGSPMMSMFHCTEKKKKKPNKNVLGR